jgi:hypothetical protein
MSSTVRFMTASWRRKYFKSSEYFFMISTIINARQKKYRQEDFDNSVNVANDAAVVAADVVESR